MHSPTLSFRVAPGIVREAFDDEIVIINLDSGTYYSLNGSGSTVWDALEAGASLDDIVAWVCEQYDGEVEEVRRHVESLLDRFAAERLVVLTDDASRPTVAATAPAERRPFTPPEFAAYSDMQELLRLDPIHDVDATGWPHRPDSGTP